MCWTSRARYFNPRAPCGARLVDCFNYSCPFRISTHAPLAGRDFLFCPEVIARWPYFNPRAPCGARLNNLWDLRWLHGFQPTRPLRGATAAAKRAAHERLISTHAPLAGRDDSTFHHSEKYQNFNPRAPCGARPGRGGGSNGPHKFQPTRPLRGATDAGWKKRRSFSISTHAPLAGRDSWCYVEAAKEGISTHAPLAGRDG